MRFVIGSDHAGKELKQKFKDQMLDLELKVSDKSPHNEEDDDYPDFAEKVVEDLDDDSMGLLICGTGIGMSIAANRYEGIRAALIKNQEEARLARAHNNANILVLGANNRLSTGDVRSILISFMKTEFEGGRHKTRVDKLDDYEDDDTEEYDDDDDEEK